VVRRAHPGNRRQLVVATAGGLRVLANPRSPDGISVGPGRGLIEGPYRSGAAGLR